MDFPKWPRDEYSKSKYGGPKWPKDRDEDNETTVLPEKAKRRKVDERIKVMTVRPPGNRPLAGSPRRNV